jgi:hypothetical protein
MLSPCGSQTESVFPLKNRSGEGIEERENLFISPVFTQFPRKQQAFNIGKTVIGCHPHFRDSMDDYYIIVVMTSQCQENLVAKSSTAS